LYESRKLLKGWNEEMTTLNKQQEKETTTRDEINKNNYENNNLIKTTNNNNQQTDSAQQFLLALLNATLDNVGNDNHSNNNLIEESSIDKLANLDNLKKKRKNLNQKEVIISPSKRSRKLEKPIRTLEENIEQTAGILMEDEGITKNNLLNKPPPATTTNNNNNSQLFNNQHKQLLEEEEQKANTSTNIQLNNSQFEQICGKIDKTNFLLNKIIELINERSTQPTTNSEKELEQTSTTLTSLTENKENDTKVPREATNELPNPGEIADPSLVPVHLEKPEYRPIAANNPMPVVTENPKEEESTSISTTIINLGEGEKEENKIIEEIITTTTIPSEGEQTEIITLKPKEEENPPPDTSTTPTDIVETTTLEEQNNLDEEELIKLMTEALKLPAPLFPSNQFWPPAANIPPPNPVYTSSSFNIPQQRPTRPFYLIKVDQLNDWIKSGKNIKILDASYDPEPLPIDHIKFYSDYYAKWDKLLLEKRNLQFERSHLEGAIPFNLNIATYPSWNERQSLYSPQLFQQYIQRLGIDQNDQLVIYGRGPNGGMVESARVWFLFRIYGHENVGIVDGGLEALQNSDFELTNGTTENISLGNWTAKFRDDLLSTFEELTTVDNYGYCILSRLFWYNFLDSRPRNEFFGLSGIYETQRGHLTGSKPFPADELVTPKGFLLSTEEILKKLTQIGYNRNYQTIVFGNTADEASLILLALALVQDTKAKLYNGGIEEIKRRAPYLIKN
uniref:Rhodanese domain-containing protein n=1 Tax=Meloidogyne floridensis TaxID=298350 RepID=A0A915P1P2_9BILA